MGKSAPSPPPAPDYAAAAKEQGTANIEAARASAKLSNPNIIGPYGNQTVKYGAGGSFDEAGYNRAMQAFSATGSGAKGPAPTQAQYQTTDEQGGSEDDVQAYRNAQLDYLSSKGVAPTREQYTTGMDMDIPTVTQTLTPEGQATVEAQQRVQRQLANLGEQGIGTAQRVMGTAFNPTTPGLRTSFDTSNLAAMPVNAGMTGQNAIMSRLQPQIERQQASTRQNLANQGIGSGSEAYRNAMTDQGQRENDLYTQAALQGIGLDTAARSQGFNEQQGIASFENQARQAQLQQESYLRQQPLNEITGLMSGSQIQLPQFQAYQGQQIAPAPIMAGAQAAGQSAMQNYGIGSANTNAANAGMMSGLGTAASIGAMAVF